MKKLCITYRTLLDGELRAFVTQQLVKYLLFMRGQVPCLYDEVRQFVETFQRQQQQEEVNHSNKRRLPVNGGIQKAVKCVEASEKLFQVYLKAIFSLRVKRVALIFGSSMMSPREAVLVDFDDEEVAITPASIDLYHLDQLDASLENLETLASPSPPVSREKLMRLCAQKLVRALFTCSTEYFACALPATKLHIAVLAERQHTRLPGFLPKQQFKLRLPKDKRGTWTHCLTICSSNGGSRMQKDLQHPAAEQTQSGDTSIVTSDTGIHSSSEQSSAKSSDSDMVWYVLEKPIAGFSEVINTLGGQ